MNARPSAPMTTAYRGRIAGLLSRRWFTRDTDLASKWISPAQWRFLSERRSGSLRPITGEMEAHSGTTTPTPTLEPVVQARLVEDGRRRAGSRLYGREQVTTLATALGFVATALSLRAVLPAEPMPSVATGIL